MLMISITAVMFINKNMIVGQACMRLTGFGNRGFCGTYILDERKTKVPFFLKPSIVK